MNPYTTWLYEDYLNSRASYPINGPQERDGNGDKRWGGPLDAWKGESNFKTDLNESIVKNLVDFLWFCPDMWWYSKIHWQNWIPLSSWGKQLMDKIFYHNFYRTSHGSFQAHPRQPPPRKQFRFRWLDFDLPMGKNGCSPFFGWTLQHFWGKNTMNKNTPMIFDDRQVLLELDPTFSWDSANPTYDARHGIVTPLWYVAMQPGGLTSDVGRWVEIRMKKSLGLFFGKGSNIPITRGVTIFRWLTYKWSILLKPLVIRSLVVLSPLDLWWVVLAKSVRRTPYQNRFEQFRFMITGSPHEWALQGSTKWICPCSCTRL